MPASVSKGVVSADPSSPSALETVTTALTSLVKPEELAREKKMQVSEKVGKAAAMAASSSGCGQAPAKLSREAKQEEPRRPAQLEGAGETHGSERHGPGKAVVARSEADWHAVRSLWAIPAAPKNVGEMLTCRADGLPCVLRAFDAGLEVLSLPLRHHCTILGNSLLASHVADPTHCSVKEQHAVLLWTAAGRFAVQPIKGPVRVFPLELEPGVKKALLGEGRPLREGEGQMKMALSLPVGSGKQALYPDRCCFRLAESRIVFLLDLLEARKRPRSPSPLGVVELPSEARRGAALAALAATVASAYREARRATPSRASLPQGRSSSSSTAARSRRPRKGVEQTGEEAKRPELGTKAAETKPEASDTQKKGSSSTPAAPKRSKDGAVTRKSCRDERQGTAKRGRRKTGHGGSSQSQGPAGGQEGATSPVSRTSSSTS